MSDETQPEARDWPLFRGFKGWRYGDFPLDLAAGLTLAAIAIPEQMATARLGGFSPQIGFFVFAAGTLGFIIFGANRHLSSGADSTITPIFAGALGALAAQGSPAYAGLAATLAVIVGVLLIGAGLARLGWIASFLSVPVTTGFLAGIAIHIVVSQLPALVGVTVASSEMPARLAAVFADWNKFNFITIGLGAIVFCATVAAERFNPRFPGALVGLAAAIACVAIFHLDSKGVAVIGAAPLSWPHAGLPAISGSEVGNIAALSLLVATVVMVQTAATTRAFASPTEPQNVNGDFIGVGAGSVFAGLMGLFPVNASPPRTAAVASAGGRSQFSGLVALIVIVAVAAFGSELLRYVPLSALAGVLFAVALRIARLSTFALVLRESPAEFAMIVATMAAIIALPIQIGVSFGIALSVLHGIWTITRARTVEFEKVPGTSVWWPPSPDIKGEKLPHVCVVAFPAPLSFLNADEFHRDMMAVAARDGLGFLIFEASAVAEIDFTAAQILLEIIERCREKGILFAIARLTSVRAQAALGRFGIADELGPHGVYRSVDDAIRTLMPDQGARPATAPRTPETR